MTAEIILFPVHILTGAAARLTFALWAKRKKTALTRFFSDLALTVVFALAYYVPRFFFADGIITVRSVLALLFGIILPGLFFRRKTDRL